jgi:hypothetical protein
MTQFDSIRTSHPNSAPGIQAMCIFFTGVRRCSFIKEPLKAEMPNSAGSTAAGGAIGRHPTRYNGPLFSGANQIEEPTVRGRVKQEGYDAE